jgi:hypothetical protein
MFQISNIRLGKEIGRLSLSKCFFELVEIVYTSIGIWGLCLIKYEIKTKKVKGKTFIGRDNIITGSFSSLNDEQKKI